MIVNFENLQLATIQNAVIEKRDRLIKQIEDNEKKTEKSFMTFDVIMTLKESIEKQNMIIAYIDHKLEEET